MFAFDEHVDKGLYLQLCSALTKSHPIEYRHELITRAAAAAGDQQSGTSTVDDSAAGGTTVTRHVVADYSALKLL